MQNESSATTHAKNGIILHRDDDDEGNSTEQKAKHKKCVGECKEKEKIEKKENKESIDTSGKRTKKMFFFLVSEFNVPTATDTSGHPTFTRQSDGICKSYGVRTDGHSRRWENKCRTAVALFAVKLFSSHNRMAENGCNSNAHTHFVSVASMLFSDPPRNWFVHGTCATVHWLKPSARPLYLLMHECSVCTMPRAVWHR